MTAWQQPLAPVHSLPLSAVVAAVPLVVVLVLMGVFRKGGLIASACGLATTAIVGLGVWRMPLPLAGWSVIYGFAVAAWSILWLVFNGLWVYNLSIAIGSFDRLRAWIQRHASGDPCVQAILVAFCFGALLEGSAGFGAPVAITAFLLTQLGFPAHRAVVVSLLANTAPVAFGGVGAPVVALAKVTGIDMIALSSMIGRQLPLLSIVLPAYLSMVVGGWAGLRRTWPVALVAGVSFAAAQFVVSNTWGPSATDVVSAMTSIVVTAGFLHVWSPAAAAPQEAPRSALRDIVIGWLPWITLAVVIILWAYFDVAPKGQIVTAIPRLHNGVLISFNSKPYAALFQFQPLASGTAVLATVALVVAFFRVHPSLVGQSCVATLRQMRVPGVTVLFIVGLAYLYNYSGMVYTLAAALAGVGGVFPLVSSYLGWVACFLTGSDTSSNILFGGLQVAAAQRLRLSPVLLAATNSSGAVAGKMISPQNISVGVTTVSLIGHEGEILRSTFWHSIAFATFIGLIACAQAYIVTWMVP